MAFALPMILCQVGVEVGGGVDSEIGVDEDGAESASNDWLLKSIEEPIVEDGTFEEKEVWF